MIQNAVDFASSRVWVDGHWSSVCRSASSTTAKDPPELIRQSVIRSSNRGTRNAGQRKGYEGMGLGLFIAKTLLERTGAKVSFANGSDPFLNSGEWPDRSGAIVDLKWPRAQISPTEDDRKGPLGLNPLIDG